MLIHLTNDCCIRYLLYAPSSWLLAYTSFCSFPSPFLWRTWHYVPLQMRTLLLKVDMMGSQPVNSQVTTWMQVFWLFSRGLSTSKTWVNSSQKAGRSSRYRVNLYLLLSKKCSAENYWFLGGNVFILVMLGVASVIGWCEGLISIFLIE